MKYVKIIDEKHLFGTLKHWSLTINKLVSNLKGILIDQTLNVKSLFVITRGFWVLTSKTRCELLFKNAHDGKIVFVKFLPIPYVKFYFKNILSQILYFSVNEFIKYFSKKQDLLMNFSNFKRCSGWKYVHR